MTFSFSFSSSFHMNKFFLHFLFRSLTILSSRSFIDLERFFALENKKIFLSVIIASEAFFCYRVCHEFRHSQEYLLSTDSKAKSHRKADKGWRSKNKKHPGASTAILSTMWCSKCHFRNLKWSAWVKYLEPENWILFFVSMICVCWKCSTMSSMTSPYLWLSFRLEPMCHKF